MHARSWNHAPDDPTAPTISHEPGGVSHVPRERRDRLYDLDWRTALYRPGELGVFSPRRTIGPPEYDADDFIDPACWDDCLSLGSDAGVARNQAGDSDSASSLVDDAATAAGYPNTLASDRDIRGGAEISAGRQRHSDGGSASAQLLRDATGEDVFLADPDANNSATASNTLTVSDAHSGRTLPHDEAGGGFLVYLAIPEPEYAGGTANAGTGESGTALGGY